MGSRVIDLQHTDDQRDAVHLAVQALAEGELVAFPTETVYGVAASALNADAVAKLLDAKGRQEGHPLTLAVKSADDALDYIPNMSPLGERLSRRCWPGPITLVFDDDHPESVMRRLPEDVRKAVAPNGTVGLRTPAHAVILSVLRLTAGPLALTSANLSGQPPAVTAQEVQAALGDKLSLILDDGKSRFAQASSVVRVKGNQFEILRAGVFNESTLKRLAGTMVLLVCTGNTCRSPMAEALMKDRIAKKLGCDTSELDDRGVVVGSAGIAAMTGGRATPEAHDAVEIKGLSLRDHESQPLTARLVNYADLILTMTKGHRDAIVGQWPEAASRVHTVCADGRDVSDPIGGPPEVYERCAAQIDEQLAHWVDRLDL